MRRLAREKVQRRMGYRKLKSLPAAARPTYVLHFGVKGGAGFLSAIGGESGE
jgi:hypothetical protein